MAKITITEALADLKTCQKRIGKKHEAVMRYLAREAKHKDPLEQDGGSIEFVRRERQGIVDLEERMVRLRCAIQQKNLETTVTIGEWTRSVQAWLNWRKEVAGGAVARLGQMAQTITQIRQQALRQGLNVKHQESDDFKDVIVAVNERQLAQESETMERMLGDLDGKLSLHNATQVIEIQD